MKNGKCFNFDEILYSAQIEGGEFNGDNRFLWFLTPVNIGTCHLLGHSFGQRAVNASILMKFCTLHKVWVVNLIMTIVFCDYRCLSILTPVHIGSCHLLGHSYFEQELQELQCWWNLKLYTNWRPWIQWWQNILWFLTPVNIDTCRYWHLSSFRPQFWTKNGKSSNFDEI